MKKIVALVLLQVAAGVIGAAVGMERGPDTGLWAQCALGMIGAHAWLAICVHDNAKHRRAVKAAVNVECRQQTDDLTPENYRLDVVAVAYGEMDEEEFDRKWAGKVPPSPRPPRERRKTSAEVALFKEIFADVKREMERPGGKPTWTCKVTLGLHDDGPCKCIALEYGPAPRFRVGQFVRFLDTIWMVTDRTPCIGPEMKWWAYYVEQGDALTVRDVRHPDEKHLTLALPHVGEVWEKRECVKHHDPLPGFSRRVRVCQEHPVDWFLHLDRAVECECGCLVPVNFGKGHEAQSFDPTKAKKVPHTGITYVMGTPRKSEKS